MNQKLINARKAAKLYQRELAEKAGLCRSTIAAMELETHGSEGKNYEELFGEE